uniref:Uncharacterized protein n=1 Tax=Anopheles farauti TaxID=69004 RepID=A0A182Q222_9DIPT
MTRSTLFACAPLLLVLLVASSLTVANEITLDQVRQEVLERIQAANVSIPTKTLGGKNLQSYRVIDPYMIADLLTGIVSIYASIIYNYPEFLLYDSADLQLAGVNYVPQRIELNYVKRV